MNSIIAVISFNQIDFMDFCNANNIIKQKGNRFIDDQGNEYICIDQERKVRGFRFNEIKTASRAYDNPNFYEINDLLQIRKTT